MRKKEEKKDFIISVVVLIITIIILLYGVVVLKQNPHIPLIFSCAVVFLYGVIRRIPWKQMRECIIDNISEAIEAILIICLIGIIIGVWMASGTVPLLIYYGLKIFSPQWFLVSVILLCSLMSIATGSSWTTIGTLGVAFMGIGEGLDIPAGITAGAIICGAYFGDKQSPLSDSTNFAAAVAKTNLYAHTRAMLYTTGPAYIASVILFLVIGLRYTNKRADNFQIENIMLGIENQFYLSPVLLLPILVLVILIIKKFPAIPTMIIAIIMGLLLALLVQNTSLQDLFSYMYSGFIGQTNIEAVDRLLTRGGLISMTPTIILMFLSLMLAGALQSTGVISDILNCLTKFTSQTRGLIITTWITTFGLSYIAADPYLAMILPANILGNKYEEIGLDQSVLSRTLEDGGTIVCPMVPWGTNGIYCSNTLGVAVGAYLPFYFLGLFTPICVLICAFTGFGVLKRRTVNGK